MKDLLLILREEFVSNRHCNHARYRGLCYAVHMLFMAEVITNDEHNKLIRYIKRYARTREFHFDSNGNVVNDASKFIWNMFDKESRIKWLDLKISRARSCTVKKDFVSL